VSSTRRLRNVTVTLEEDVAQWARIEAARHDTSVSRLLGALLKERISAQHGPAAEAAEAAERLASFGQRHRLSLRGLKIKDLINEGRGEGRR
jgi:plasmid stability protein